jgi:predicted transcriptional regulator
VATLGVPRETGGPGVRRRRPQLGALERLVLDRLWSQGEADVKTMHAAVGIPRGIASNTVQSALERLFRKGLCERAKIGRAYAYRARVSRREWVARSLEGLFESLPGADPHLLLSGFVDLAERAGAAHLAELERMVKERRQERGGRDHPDGEGTE